VQLSPDVLGVHRERDAGPVGERAHHLHDLWVRGSVDLVRRGLDGRVMNTIGWVIGLPLRRAIVAAGRQFHASSRTVVT
jgi:hypothetical protein